MQQDTTLDTVTTYTKQCYLHKMFSTKVDIAVPAVISTSTSLPAADIHYLQYMTELRRTHNSYCHPLQHSDPLSRHTIILLLFLHAGPQKDFVSHVPVHNPTGSGRALSPHCLLGQYVSPSHTALIHLALVFCTLNTEAVCSSKPQNVDICLSYC